MTRIACTTMPGAGNVNVFDGLRDQLVARGHDVQLTSGHGVATSTSTETSWSTT